MMASLRTHFLRREAHRFHQKFNSLHGISIVFDEELAENKQHVLTAFITGVHGTPYEGGFFELQLNIPDEYPYKPPIVKFVTKIWHPNVHPIKGTVCIDLAAHWSPVLSLYAVLRSIQFWLNYPCADEPLVAEIGRQCLERPLMFERTARFWTQKFAGGGGPLDEQLQRMVDEETVGWGNETNAVLSLSMGNWITVAEAAKEQKVQDWLLDFSTF